MLAGTFVLEDHSIHFRALKDGRIEYTVQDELSGATATKNVDMAEFSAAMYIALNGDEDADEGMYALAEEAMPRAHNVHGEAELAKENAEKVAGQLRWIP